MSTQTEHLKLDLREAADIFNPLSTNANFESLDNIIYEIQTKGGVPTYTTTASANLLKLSQNPTPNVTVFKFVAAGDANTWSYQETVNNIVALDGTQKTVKAGEMYVAWVNSANAMVVIAWPDVVNAQTFDGKGPAEWASKAQLDAVNQTAANATQTAQAAATVANQALTKANAKYKEVVLYSGGIRGDANAEYTTPIPANTMFIGVKCKAADSKHPVAVIPYVESTEDVVGTVDCIGYYQVSPTATSGQIDINTIELHKTYAIRLGYMSLKVNAQNGNAVGAFFTGGTDTTIIAYVAE